MLRPVANKSAAAFCAGVSTHLLAFEVSDFVIFCHLKNVEALHHGAGKRGKRDYSVRGGAAPRTLPAFSLQGLPRLHQHFDGLFNVNAPTTKRQAL
jgi:hypothetical protein